MEDLLRISFVSEVIHWRGPAPFFFLRVPEQESSAISEISEQLSYGWGVIPCDVTCGSIDFYTALFPKDGGYLVPLRKSVRESEGIELGESVKVEIRFKSSLKGE